MIHKALVPLRTLADWQAHAPPKSANQWKAGRSATETARAWVGVEPPNLPVEVAEVLDSHDDFEALTEWRAEPEALVPFDDMGGQPSNVDLLLEGQDLGGRIVMAVEGKADEPFGATVAKTFSAALERRVASARSRGVDRIQGLAGTLFTPITTPGIPRVAELRYQLLTVSAAALAGARRAGAERAVVLVHEFRTALTKEENLRRNALDLTRFVRRLSGNPSQDVEPGRLYGPFTVPGRLKDGTPALYVGKAARNVPG